MHRYADCYIAWLLKTAEPAKGCSEVVVSPWEEVGKQQKFSKILCFFCPRSLISHFESFLTPPRWLRWPTEWKLQSNEAKSAANELVEIQFSTLITLGIVCEEWQCHWAEFSPKTENFSDIVWDYGATYFRLMMLQTSTEIHGDRPVICDRSPVRVTSGLMVQHLRCRWKVGCFKDSWFFRCFHQSIWFS